MLNSTQYNALKSIVSEISQTANLAASLKEYAEESEILARLLSDHFANSEEKCAEFIKENSSVKTSINVLFFVKYAQISANFAAEEELSEDSATSFIEENISDARVHYHELSEFEIEDLNLYFTYQMKNLEQVSYAA